MTPFDAAHQYATAGYRVFPLGHHSKNPLIKKADGGNGCLDGTTDTDQIEAWWTKAPRAGIGVSLGAHPTHGYVFAVDIDEHGADGEAVWRDLCDGYDWTEPDDCPEQITGGGGRHLLFTAPHEIRNGELGPDVQTRGEGGYIVVEPSIHPDSGQQYGWTEGREPWTVEPTPAPEWMLAHLKPPDRVVRERVDDPNDTRPGTRWMRATSWASILEPDGWTPAGSGREVDAYWTRPGKRRGISASQGYAGSDVLTVFTSSVPFLESFRTYDKLGYIAARDHAGDIAAAARWAAGEVGDATTPPTGAGGVPSDRTLRTGDATTSATHAVADTEPDQWPEITPITTERELTPWPTHVLPPWISEHIDEMSDQLQVPPDLCAQLAVGALAAVTMGHAEVLIGPHWREPTNLYLATAMHSGAGKSPAEKAFVGPLRRWEAERAKRTEDQVRTAESERRIAEKIAKSEEDKAVKAGTDGKAAAAAWAKAEAIEVPPRFRISADDATPEALVTLLERHNERIALLSTEADVLDMAAGQYATGGRVNLSVYLKAWSGDTIQRDRKGGSDRPGEALTLDNPLLTVGLTMQPSVLDKYRATSDELRGRGFFARFMWSVPKATLGHRDRYKALEVGNDTTTAYAEEFTALASRLATWGRPAWLRCSHAAAVSLVDFQAQLEPMIAPGKPLAALGEMSSKLCSSVARFAGILHLADGGEPDAEIAEATMHRALEVGRYWLDHAMHVEGVGSAFAGVDAESLMRAEIVLGWITAKGVESFTPRDVYRARHRQFRDTEATAPGIEVLAACGYLRFIEGGAGDIGVPRSTVVVEVNPAVFETTTTPREILEKLTTESALRHHCHQSRKGWVLNSPPSDTFAQAPPVTGDSGDITRDEGSDPISAPPVDNPTPRSANWVDEF